MEHDPATGEPLYVSIRRLEELLARQSRILSDLTDEAVKNHSIITALIALSQALVESHPNPTALAQSFLDQIDAIGSIASDKDVECYRSDIQKINAFILEVVNRPG